MTSDQEAELRARGKQAVADLIMRLANGAEDIVELSVQRARTLGADEYGDASYTKDAERLGREVDEELADAVFYQHVILRQSAQV